MVVKLRKPRWRIELMQFGAERVPSRWQRFWGGGGNHFAWRAEFWREDEDGVVEFVGCRYGCTGDEAVLKAEARIEELKAGAAGYERRVKVLYVQGS